MSPQLRRIAMSMCPSPSHAVLAAVDAMRLFSMCLYGKGGASTLTPSAETVVRSRHRDARGSDVEDGGQFGLPRNCSRNCAGVRPVQRLNARWNELSSEKPRRKPTSLMDT